MKSPVDTAIAAAKESGEVLLSHFGSIEPSAVVEKAKNDVVSHADKESEAVLRRVLLGAHPSDVFLGEGDGVVRGGRVRSCLDLRPARRHGEFVRGFPHFAVSIARTRGGLLGPIEVGVVWDPVKKDLFAAEAGGGAFRTGRG